MLSGLALLVYAAAARQRSLESRRRLFGHGRNEVILRDEQATNRQRRSGFRGPGMEASHEEEERVRMMKTVIRGVAIVLGLTLAGCGGAGEKPAATKEAEKAKTVAEAPKKTEGPKGPYIGAFRIGHGLGSNGSVAVEGAVFALGEPVFVSFDVVNAPTDGKVRLLLQSAADEKTLYQEEASIAAGKSPNVSYKIEMKSWPVGDYVLRIALSAASTKTDNAGLGQATLKIVKERPK